VVQGAGGLDVAAQFVEPGTELEGGAQKKFGAHRFKVVLIQSALDAAKAGGEFLKLFLEGREIFLLQLFELERFHDVYRAMIGGIGFPIEESGFGDAELSGDGAEAPAVGAHDEESVFRFGGVHRI